MHLIIGKSKTIQFKIEEDFNKMDLGNPQINLYDLVQKYCSELAAVGNGEQIVVRAVSTDKGFDKCLGCGKKGHTVRECRKLHKKTRKAIEKKLKKGEQVVVCYECRELGHYKADCPKLKKQASTTSSSSDSDSDDKSEEAKRTEESAIVPVPAAPSVVSSARPTDTSRISPEHLHMLVQAMRGQ